MSRLQFRLQNRRRGATMIIVVAFLGLGLTLGIAFLFKAMHQARFMQMVRESGQGGRAAGVNTGTLGNNDEAPPQPSDLFNSALGQLIYDVADPVTPNDETGVFNGLRGHSLARSMYGWNASNPTGNTIAYSGFGRTHGVGASDWYSYINYSHLPGFININPERESGSYIAKCAPYTYPDENNLFLAAVTSDGRVLVPSFHRPWLVGSPTNPIPATNMWLASNPQGKFRMLRPRRADNTPAFPAGVGQPEFQVNADGSWGDVENLEGKASGRQLDSVWIDLDTPVRKWKGRLYKPLYAFLIVDLDGRINANVAENLKGPGFTTTSDQGWGPWEMNMNALFGGALNSGEQFLKSANVQYRRYQAQTAPTKVYSLDNLNPSWVGAPYLLNDASAPFYSWIDFDASTQTNPGARPQLQLPGFGGVSQYNTSPAFASRNANGSIAERTNHPLFYNPYLVPTKRPTGGNTDRAFGPEDLFYLNHKLNGESPAFYRNADMAKLVPQLATPTLPLGNPRWLLTPTSNDLQVPGLRPWRTPGGATYQKPGVYPPVLASGGPIASPPSGNQVFAPNSDYNTNPVSDWRSVVAALGSVDLNRKLTDYRTDPTQGFEVPVGGQANGAGVNFARAQADRQALAGDIYFRLAAATGARTSAAETPPLPGSPEYNALRQLAQMAVNIVDYIDNDDYMTPFDWLGNGTEILWGTELPRLVVNEAYAQVSNKGRIPLGKALGWINNGNNHYQIWVELYNPLTPPGGSDANLSHSGGAPLVFNGNAVYQLKILPNNNYDSQLRQEANLTVNPAGDITPPPPGTFVVSPLWDNTSLSPQPVVMPSNATAGTGAYGGNPGFYLVGPGPVPGTDNTQVTFKTTTLDRQTAPDPNGGMQALPNPPTLLLQRLACPHMLPQANPALPNYNPYITVDYTVMPNGSVFDYREANGMTPMPLPLPNFNTFSSFGRSQPYAAKSTNAAGASVLDANGNAIRLQKQQHVGAVVPTQVNQTFYRQNNSTTVNWPLDNPFDWLVHLDRQLISPAELLCVSAWKPHELTQQFITLPGPGAPRHQHLADWVSSGARLYRALAVLEVRNRTLGMAFGGRVPGRVNMNTMWDSPVLQAMADRESGNLFTPADVNNAWAGMVATRSPMIGSGSAATVWTNAPQALTDRPFLPGPNFTPAPDLQLYGLTSPTGEDATRSLVGSGLFAVPGPGPGPQHPYLKNELINKIFNNVTTRSNTFAVWCTVGYFEVENPGPYSAANRPRLGAELDLDVGANIRHKFFTVVDRTNLAIDPTSSPTRPLQGGRPVFLSYEPATADVRNADVDTTVAANRTNGSIVVRVPALARPNANTLTGLYDGAPWSIQNGDVILLDVGPNQEPATVTAVAFTAGVGGNVTLTLPVNPNPPRHARGCAMQLVEPVTRRVPRLGNPGPQPNFNCRDQRYSGVVRFFTQVH